MLTTTVDGLWVLQAVTGVEQTCPELGLRPLLPRLDTAERALRHPVAAELMAVGALDQAGNADPMVREWLTVLATRPGVTGNDRGAGRRTDARGHLPICHLVGGLGTPRQPGAALPGRHRQ